MHFIKGEPRDQFYNTSLEDEVEQDNPVRLIDILVEMILQQMPETTYPKGKSHLGRRAFSASQMLKLYIYGYMNKVQSSRRLERECIRNIELKWLLGNLRPDYKTIADFRRDNHELISFVTLTFRKMLLTAGFAMGKILVLDGSKFKANASSQALSQEQIAEILSKAKHDHQRYLIILQSNDCKESTDETGEDSDILQSLKHRVAELEQTITKYERLQSVSAGEKNRRVSPVDEESRLVTSQGLKSFNGYNVQALVDEFNKLILGAFVSNSSVDYNEMIPALEVLKEELGLEPEIIVADQGYNNALVLQEIEKKYVTEAYVAIGTTSEQATDDKFSRQDFTYDEENDCFICPKGFILKRRGGIQTRKKRTAIINHSSRVHCRDCSLKAQCTDNKEGRSLTRYTDEKWVAYFRSKMQTAKGRALITRRKAIVEHVFGIIKCWMGKIPLLLRGKRKVQTEIDLYTTAYNLKRLHKLVGFDKLVHMFMEMQREYAPFSSINSSIIEDFLYRAVWVECSVIITSVPVNYSI